MVTASPPIVMTGASFVGATTPANELVAPLIIIADADGAREYVDPDTTMAEEPAANVWLSTI